jgi:hypothetical protein
MVDPTIQPMLPKVIAAAIPHRTRRLSDLLKVVVIVFPLVGRVPAFCAKGVASMAIRVNTDQPRQRSWFDDTAWDQAASTSGLG